jgi:hypothetical protein
MPANAPEIGECIYCGTKDGPLSTEHAVPYGINGAWTLLKATCGVCANVTHRFERDTLRNLWGSVRIALKMQSRRRKQRPATLPLIVRKNGVMETLQVPYDEYPAYLPMPLFPAPIPLWKDRPLKLVEGVFANFDVIHVAGPTFQQAAERFPEVEFCGASASFSPPDFARMIAKIGYCAAVYCLGLKGLTHSPIRNVILGTDPYIANHVGCWWGEPVNGSHGGLYEIRVKWSPSDLGIHAFVRLFAQFGAPEYHVMLGPVDPATTARWPASWR